MNNIKNSKIQMYKVIAQTFFGTFGSNMLNYGISLMILRRTGSALSFGITILLVPLINLFLSPFTGHLADRYDRKKLIVMAQVVSILTLILFAGLYRYSDISILLMVSFVISLLAFGDAFFQSASNASIASVVLDDDIKKLSSFKQGMGAGSQLVAPVLGAFLYSAVNFEVYIILVAAFELIALILNYTIDYKFNKNRLTQESESVYDDNNPFISMYKTLKFLMKRDEAKSLFQVAIVMNFLAAVIIVGIPLVLVRDFKATNFQYSLFQVSAVTGMILFSLYYGMSRRKEANVFKVLFICSIVFGVVLGMLSIPYFITMANVYKITIYIVFSFAFGIGAAMINVPLNVFFHKHIHESLKGRVFALMTALMSSLVPLGTLFYSLLFEYFTPKWIFVITGLFVVAVMVYFYVKVDKRILTREDFDDFMIE